MLVARTAVVPVPKLEPKPAAVPQTTTKFKIRMLGGLSSSLLVAQIEKIFFQIWAPSLSVTTFYEYSSVGVGKGAGASMSATLEGPFNDFSTTSAISTTDFGGAARFTTSGVGPFSVNFLNLMGEPDPPPDLGLADRAPPPDAPAEYVGLLRLISLVDVVVPIVACLVLGWILWRLRPPAVREQFR